MCNNMSRDKKINKTENKYDMYSQFSQHRAYITMQRTNLPRFSYVSFQIVPIAKVDSFEVKWRILNLELVKRSRPTKNASILESTCLLPLKLRRLELIGEGKMSMKKRATHLDRGQQQSRLDIFGRNHHGFHNIHWSITSAKENKIKVGKNRQINKEE